MDMQTIKKSYTPLILATKNQHLLVVKYLVDHGANPHLRDKDGKNAIDYAHEKNNFKIIKLIQEAIDRIGGNSDNVHTNVRFEETAPPKPVA
jgi:ankyrin repeat protein